MQIFTDRLQSCCSPSLFLFFLSLQKAKEKPAHQIVLQDLFILWLVNWELRHHLFMLGGQKLGNSYETKPQRGWRKRPTVPRTHTVTNTQRKILSITMATYFQSSSTCEEEWDKNISCESTEEGSSND